MLPIVNRGGKLIWSVGEKTLLFLAHFDAKQFRYRFQQPHSCHPSPILCSVAFRSSFIRSLLLGLVPYGRCDPDGMFTLFYKQVAGDLASKLAVIYKHLVKGEGSFLAFWRLRCCPCAKGVFFLGCLRI